MVNVGLGYALNPATPTHETGITLDAILECSYR